MKGEASIRLHNKQLRLRSIVPLKIVTEDYGSQTFVITPQNSAVTTLIVKKGWTISGSFVEASGNQFTFAIYAPDGYTYVFQKSGSSSGTFSFVSESGGSYRVYMFNPASSGFLGMGVGPTITVTLQAKQTGVTTVI